MSDWLQIAFNAGVLVAIVLLAIVVWQIRRGLREGWWQ